MFGLVNFAWSLRNENNTGDGHPWVVVRVKWLGSVQRQL